MNFDIAIINLLTSYNVVLDLKYSYVLYINSLFLKLLMRKRRYLYLAVKAGCVDIVVNNSLDDYNFKFEKVITNIEEIL